MPTQLTCPECGGAFWGGKEKRLGRFQRGVDHPESLGTLEAEDSGKLAGTLWGPPRALEEGCDLTGKPVLSGANRERPGSEGAGPLKERLTAGRWVSIVPQLPSRVNFTHAR